MVDQIKKHCRKCGVLFKTISKRPVCDLPYQSMADENFRKCWALDNLRPLSAKQNIMDGVCRRRHNVSM